MLTALLSALLFIPLSIPAPLARALELEAAIEAQEDPALWRAIWQVECSGMVYCKRSAAGACCPMQVLGGRYGNPPCEALEASPWLCVVTADRQMERCRRMCKREYVLECFHSGGPGCRGETDGSYTRKVMRWRRKEERDIDTTRR